MGHWQRFKVFWEYSRAVSRSAGRPYALLLSWILARLVLRFPFIPLKLIHVPTEIKGKKILLPVRLNTTDTFLVKEIFGDLQYASVGLPHHAARILDLGANVGFATLFFAALYPDAEFACVEPASENVETLRQTLALNSVNATVIEGAVGAESGSRNFDRSSAATSGHLSESDLSGVPVETFSFRDLLKKIGWNCVDLIKIDIEGAEHELIVKDPEAFLVCSYILLELHDWIPKQEVLAALTGVGFVGDSFHSEQGGEVFFLTRVARQP